MFTVITVYQGKTAEMLVQVVEGRLTEEQRQAWRELHDCDQPDVEEAEDMNNMFFREFEALIALNTPDKAGAYYRLAESNFGQGRKDAAKTNVMKALEIAPSYEPALELLLKVR